MGSTGVGRGEEGVTCLTFTSEELIFRALREGEGVVRLDHGDGPRTAESDILARLGISRRGR
jgi:hypothetical protein